MNRRSHNIAPARVHNIVPAIILVIATVFAPAIIPAPAIPRDRLTTKPTLSHYALTVFKLYIIHIFCHENLAFLNTRNLKYIAHILPSLQNKYSWIINYT